jgi:Fe-S cluster assembly protein SufD
MLETYWLDFLGSPDPLQQMRKKGWDRFLEIGLPKEGQEAFQYLNKKFTFPPLTKRKQLELEPCEGLVFVDGFFEESLSFIQAPVICLPLDQAIRSYGLFLQNRMNKTIREEKDPFAAVNAALQGRGAFIYVPPKCKAALHLIHHFLDPGMASPRIHLYVGKNAELNLTQSSNGTSGFYNNLIDLVLDEGAQLYFSDYSEGHFQSIRSTLKRDSKFKAVFLGKQVRSSIQVELTEENSEAEMLGLSRLEAKEEAHFHTNMEHKAPHTRSRQHFKSVVNGQAKFSFEGKIHVFPVAQKTESYQLNNNLILSDEASANAKPNLEIFADDVKASHGATMGQLDEEQLFYLRSRGLSLTIAKEWLISGFCQEILDHAR